MRYLGKSLLCGRGRWVGYCKDPGRVVVSLDLAGEVDGESKILFSLDQNISPVISTNQGSACAV